MVEECIPSLDRSDDRKFDFKLARLLEENQSTGKKNFILSLIALLNRHHDKIVDEHLIPLLSAFFSVYEIYQVHLSEPVKKKLELTNLLDHYVTNRMSSTSSQHNKSKTKKSSAPLDPQPPATNLIIELAKKDLLTDIPPDFIKSLVSKMSYDSAKLLATLHKKIPSHLIDLVIDKIISMIKNKSRDSIYQAFTLIKAYFSVMGEKNQKLVIEYLQKIILGKMKLPSDYDHTYENIALKTLDKILSHINKRHHKEIIDMLSKVLDRQLSYYNIKTQKEIFYPAKILLKLRILCSSKDAERISLLIKDFILTKTDESIKLLTTEWKLLTSNEQNMIVTLIIKKLGDDQMQNKIIALEMMANINDLSNLEKKQDELFSLLYSCVSSSNQKVNSAALSALSNLTSSIPEHWNKKFLMQLTKLSNKNMSYVIDLYQHNLIKTYNLSSEIDKDKRTHVPTLDNFGFDLFLLTELSLSSPKKASSLASQLLTEFDLFEDMTLDLIGFRTNLQYWVMRSVVLLREYISQDLYKDFADRFIIEARKDSEKITIFVLADLIKTMPKELKIKTATELAKTVLLNHENTMELILPYVDYLSYDYKIYMLHHLILSPSQELGKLFSALYASCQKDIIEYNLEHVHVNEHIVPNELIDNIMSFMRC